MLVCYNFHLKPSLTEVLLGAGVGLGYLTSLRFLGPIGVPELLIVIGLFSLVRNKSITTIKYYSLTEYLVKIYLCISVFFIMPIMTFITYNLLESIQLSTPIYIIGYMLGFMITLYLGQAIVAGVINPKSMALMAVLSFILTNLFSIYVLELNTPQYDGFRYTGGSDNPNQITFYAAALCLMCVMYLRKLTVILLPLIIFIAVLARSDAFMLYIIVSGIAYFLCLLFFSSRLSYALKSAFAVLSFIALFVYMVNYHSEYIFDTWSAADEGGVRVDLMINALHASMYSPLFGYGAGAFSGIDKPFTGSEAHNTPLDLALQFGLPFIFVTYGVVIYSIHRLLKNRDFIGASFVFGFLVAGLFHFYARHFIFWIELAIIFTYTFPAVKKSL
jgi:hypothetical protein